MPEQPEKTANSATTKSESYEQLVRKLADQIYEMWQRELRYERERKGSKGK